MAISALALITGTGLGRGTATGTADHGSALGHDTGSAPGHHTGTAAGHATGAATAAAAAGVNHLDQRATHDNQRGPGHPGFELVDPDGAHLGIRDLGVSRGDGIFETIGVAFGVPQALEPHLTRFATSASALDLPAPDVRVWRAAIAAVCAVLADEPESFVKIVITRGVEGTGTPTGWAYGAVSADYSRERSDGVRITILDRGYRHDVTHTAPWLLAGAKTLSYAVHTAALREADRRGADDVIFVSSDGFVLEGPTSTVIARIDGRLLTPGPGLPILAGTTQAAVFDIASTLGIPTGFALLSPSDLSRADAAWLVSSVRHAAPIAAIDGTPMPIDHALTSTLNAALGSREGASA